MEAKKAKKNKVRGIKNAFIVIIICFIVALVVFTQVLGAPENFEGGDPAGGHPQHAGLRLYQRTLLRPAEVPGRGAHQLGYSQRGQRHRRYHHVYGQGAGRRGCDPLPQDGH